MVGRRINKDKQEIINMYNNDKSIVKIAKKYGVAATTIHRRLRKWGIEVKRRRNYEPRMTKYNMKKKELSTEILAKIKENTRINNKYIKFYRTIDTEKDRFLVRNILRKSRAIANE